MFNYITVNQDDHSKNFAFLADDNDNWRLSPFYDIVYSPCF
ncbi:HipA domain-containing protein [Aliivibrio sifiae]|nr:HipA domain-containing protein [Aliivibrio sifiae]